MVLFVMCIAERLRVGKADRLSEVTANQLRSDKADRLSEVTANQLRSDKAKRCRIVCLLAPLLAYSFVSANEFTATDQPPLVNLGMPLTDAQVKALPSHVFADGSGLPDGSGSAEKGAKLYSEHCANCHGSVGQGAKALELVGDRSLLATEYPDKGIAVYWPFAPTLYEYINRSMPPATPGIFGNDELYSLIAHLLVMNGVFNVNEVLDKQSLSNIRLPNENGFNTVAH